MPLTRRRSAPRSAVSVSIARAKTGHSTGFRPGGNNRPVYITTATGPRKQDVPPFAADTLSNYEIGCKTSWFDRKLYVDGAIFWEEWNKVQYSQSISQSDKIQGESSRC